jgi:uncharacterized protein
MQSTDRDVIAAIRDTAAALSKVAQRGRTGCRESARHVSNLLVKLVQSDTAVRSKAEAAVIRPLIYDLDRLRKSLDPQEITLKTLPASLVGTWLLPDGRARVEVLPKGDPTDTSVLRKFATAVQVRRSQLLRVRHCDQPRICAAHARSPVHDTNFCFRSGTHS